MPLKQLLVFVSVALLVDTSAYAAITPLLPGLSDEHALTKGEAGILSAAYPAGTLLLALPAAWLATRIGARATVIVGLVLLAASSLVFGLGGSAPLLIAARFLQGIGAAASWAGALAWLVALAPRERRAEMIGSAVGAAIAGALAGPALGAAADAIGLAVVYCAFVALPAAMVVWALRLPGAPPVALLGLGALRSVAAEPRMRAGMWLMAVPALGFGVINVLVPLRMDELGATAVGIGAAFLCAVALEALVSPLAGRAADRRGRVWPARIGLMSGGVCVALLPLPGSAVLVGAVVVFTAPLLGMLWTPAMAMLSDGAEARGVDPAFGFGLSNLAWGLGAMVGAGGGGALGEVLGDAVPYLLLAAIAIVTALALRERAPVPARAPA